MRRALILKECFKMRLPSGRALTYYDLRTEPGDKISASTTMNGAHRQFYWGGVLFENLIQAIARDVLLEAILALEGLGIPVLWSAHDEVVCEVDPEMSSRKILSVMRTPPSWMPDLPLEAEVMTAIRYLK
jgi:DNA polymerase